MSLKYKISTDVKATSYEGVKILPNTPKNPNDFHAMQDIVKYRLVSMLKELYGNGRIDNNQTTFIVESNKVKANGLWYFDGYRMEVTNLLSEDEAPEANFSIYLLVSFTTIDFKEDSSIALQDQGTNKFIPTSERYKFEYQLAFTTIDQIPPVPGNGIDGVYKIGECVYTLGDPHYTFNDPADLPVVTLKYVEAMEIAASAIHINPDGWAYVEKLATDNDRINAYIDGSTDIVKIGVRDHLGNEFITLGVKDAEAHFPYLKFNGANGNTELTDNSLYFLSGTNAETTYSADYVTMWTPSAQMVDINDSIFSYRMRFITTPGFAVKLLAKQKLEKLYPAEEVEGDYAPPSQNYHKAKYIYSQPGLSQVGSPVYKFAVNAANYPTTGTFTINQKIRLIAGQNLPGYITFKLYFADSTSPTTPPDEQFNLLKTFSWSLNHDILNPIKINFHPHPSTGQEPITVEEGPLSNNPIFNPEGEVIILDPNANSNNFIAHFKLEYTIVSEESVTGIVEFLQTKNIFGHRLTTPFLATQMDFARLGKYFMWMDSEGRLRIKYMPNSDDGSIIDALGFAPGLSTTDPGGMAIQAGVQYLNTLNGAVTLLAVPDNTIDGPIFSINETNKQVILRLPSIDVNANAVVGLLSREGYQGLLNAIIQGGTGIQTINGHLEANQNITTAINLNSTGNPTFVWNDTTKSHVLQFPLAAYGGNGLVAFSDHRNFRTASFTTRPSNARWVAKVWNLPYSGSPVSVSTPWYTSIQTAINDAIEGETIFVHPGQYDEDIILKSGVDIIAYDPHNTFITGTVADNDGSPSSNPNGVKCKLQITIDTSLTGVNDDLALKIDRSGSLIYMIGNVISRSGAGSLPTIAIMGGRLRMYGNIGKYTVTGGMLGAGISVNNFNGNAEVLINGDIIVSSVSGASFKCGIQAGFVGAQARVKLKGRIICGIGVDAGVYAAELGLIEVDGDIEVTSTSGITRCVYADGNNALNQGKVILRNGKIISKNTAEAPIIIHENGIVVLDYVRIYAAAANSVFAEDLGCTVYINQSSANKSISVLATQIGSLSVDAIFDEAFNFPSILF